jgi:hypothetical protein
MHLASCAEIAFRLVEALPFVQDHRMTESATLAGA